MGASPAIIMRVKRLIGMFARFTRVRTVHSRNLASVLRTSRLRGCADAAFFPATARVC